MSYHVTGPQQLVVTAGAYSALDAVGVMGSFVSLPRSGKIISITLYDAAKQSAALYLNLFKDTFTGLADNAAFDLLDAERNLMVGSLLIPAASYAIATNSSISTVTGLGLPYYAPSGVLHYQLSTITASTPTYVATTDLSISIGIEY